MFVCGVNNYSQLDKNSINKNFDGTSIIDQYCTFHVNPSLFSSFSTNSRQTVWIAYDGKPYVTGYNNDGRISGSLPKKALPEDTSLFLKDSVDQQCKFISVVCGLYYTLYLVSSESGDANLKLVYCYSDKTPNPLFVNIGKRTPRALFGGNSTSGVIDTEGGIIVLTESVFESPTDQVEASFLPGCDKPVKLACCNGFVIALGVSGRVYESKIRSGSMTKFEEVKELADSAVVDVSGTYDSCFAVLNDGRVFGRGGNFKCKLGLPKETKSISTFTLIKSLNKHKIVSVFAGTSHSIFKTAESKMIVCGSNKYGQLFIPSKEFVYPPEEVPKCQGFTFCVTGDAASAAFFGIEEPPNFSNKKMTEGNDAKDKSKAKQENDEMVSRREFEELQQKLLAKEEEISNLKEENLNVKTQNEEKEKRIQKVEQENTNLKEANANLETQNEEYENHLKKVEEEKSKMEARNKEYEKRLKKVEEENSELKKKITNLEEAKSSQVKTKPLPILGSEEMKMYKKGKRIGRGATSEVYEVTQETKLVMKVLDLEMLITTNKEGDDDDDDGDSDDDKNEINVEQAKRFLQECEVLNELEDDHIIKTYGFFFGTREESPAIILEHCQSNLKKRIKKITNDERIQIIVDVSSAMKKVHSKGIIHRDLKLENILLDENNGAKLSDFGLCTFITNDDETKSYTEMAGTLKYMSPELLQGRRDYDEKVDVYAFGVVLFAILTKGEYPDISVADVSAGKQAEIPSNITEFSSKLILDCWSFQSKDRPSFSEICDRLKGNEHKLI